MTGSAFFFDNQYVEYAPHDMLADALLRENIWKWHESYALGRPEGLYCGIGRCGSCRVSINSQPNRLLCITPARPNQIVHTYQTGEWPMPAASQKRNLPLVRHKVPVTIVGAGLAGRSMQRSLAQAHVLSLLIDERPWRIRNHDAHELTGSVVGMWSHPHGMRLWADCGDYTADVVARTVILATGAVVVPPLVPGGRLPRVFTWDALNALCERGATLAPGGIILGPALVPQWVHDLAASLNTSIERWDSADMISISQGPPGEIEVSLGISRVLRGPWVALGGEVTPSLELYRAWGGPARTWSKRTGAAWGKDGSVCGLGAVVNPNARDDEVQAAAKHILTHHLWEEHAP
jgi:hypothetical protein